ncbi:CPLX4 protein, partial [Polypterus senegalus]
MVSSQVKNLGLGGGEEVKKEDGAATDPAAAAGMTREEYEEYQRQVVEENVVEVLPVLPEALRAYIIPGPAAFPGVAEALPSRDPQVSWRPLAVTTGPNWVELPSSAPVASMQTRAAACSWPGEGIAPLPDPPGVPAGQDPRSSATMEKRIPGEKTCADMKQALRFHTDTDHSSEQDENAIQMAGDDIDVPEELRKMVDMDAVEEEEKDSILGQIQNIQNMDMDTIKEKAQATLSEMKQAAEQKCLLM